MKEKIVGSLSSGQDEIGIGHPLIVQRGKDKYIAKGYELTNKEEYGYSMFNEMVCSCLAKYFHVDIPDYYVESINNSFWYCSKYIEGFLPQPAVLRKIPSVKLAHIAVYDIFISNRDRRFCNLICSYEGEKHKVWVIDHGRCLLAPFTNWDDLKNEYPLNLNDLILIPDLFMALRENLDNIEITIDWDELYSNLNQIPRNWCPNGNKDILDIFSILHNRYDILNNIVNEVITKFNNSKIQWKKALL